MSQQNEDAEELGPWEYVDQAGKTADVAALRKIVGQIAREWNLTTEQLNRLHSELSQQEAQDERAALDLRRANAARQVVAAKAIRALAKLLPIAIAQARKGKPALLRMILRATK